MSQQAETGTENAIMELLGSRIPEEMIEAFKSKRKRMVKKLLQSVKEMGRKYGCEEDLKHVLRMTAHSLLHEACKNSWFDMVQSLIDEFEYDICRESSSNYTPLHEACKSGSGEFVKSLIIELNLADFVKSKKHKSFLQVSLEASDHEVLFTLIREGWCDINLEGIDFLSKIIAIHGLLQQLIENYDFQPKVKELDANDYNFRKEVKNLLNSGSLDFIKYIYEKCDGFNSWVQINAEHLLDITYSCEIIQFLICTANCNSNVLVNGSTILVHACKANKISMVIFLVEKCGCDPTYQYEYSLNKESPLIAVCKLGHSEIFEYLISLPKVKSKVHESEHCEFLLSVANQKCTTIMRVLIENSELDKPARVCKACVTGDLDTVKHVLRGVYIWGTIVNSKQLNFLTPLCLLHVKQIEWIL